MARAQKTVSVRLEEDDFRFLSRLAEAEDEDLSTAVRGLIAAGRVLIAVERELPVQPAYGWAHPICIR